MRTPLLALLSLPSGTRPTVPSHTPTRGTGSIRIPNGNPCAGTTLGLNNTAQLADVVRANASGVATLDVNVHNAACDRIHVQAIDLDSCGTTNVVQIN